MRNWLCWRLAEGRRGFQNPLKGSDPFSLSSYAGKQGEREQGGRERDGIELLLRLEELQRGRGPAGEAAMLRRYRDQGARPLPRRPSPRPRGTNRHRLPFFLIWIVSSRKRSNSLNSSRMGSGDGCPCRSHFLASLESIGIGSICVIEVDEKILGSILANLKFFYQCCSI